MRKWGLDFKMWPRGIIKQRFKCRDCGSYHSSSKQPKDFGMRYSNETKRMALEMALFIPAERVGEVMGLTPNTVRLWVKRLVS